MRKTLCFALASAVACGCSAFKESYIVKITTGKYGDQLEPAQFYRYRVSGWSVFQRTEFQCGWYDKDAVDQLFSEVVVETSARNVATGGAQPTSRATRQISATPATHDESRYLTMGPGGESFDATNRRFVMIAANNPKVIAQQISALANNKQIAGAFADILQKPARLANLDARNRLALAVKAHEGVDEAMAAASKALEDMNAGSASAAAVDSVIQRALDAVPKLPRNR